MSSLKQTLALLSWLCLAGCSRHSASESLTVDPSLPSCAPLKPLQLPSGLTVPPEDKHYQIPPKPLSSKIDYPLDLRPPIQPLALLPASEAYYQGKQAILQLEQTTNARRLWQRLKYGLVRQDITTIAHDDSKKIIFTDWVKPDLLDGTIKYSARYQISLSSEAPVKLIIELSSLGKLAGHATPTKMQEHREHHPRPFSLGNERVITTKEGEKITIPPAPVFTPPSSFKPDENKRVEPPYQKKIPTASEQRHYAILMLNRLASDLAKPTTAADTPVQVTPPPKN